MEELLLDATLSHYRIVSKIGAGGMGEVCLTHNTKLGRAQRTGHRGDRRERASEYRVPVLA